MRGFTSGYAGFTVILNLYGLVPLYTKKKNL